MKVYKASMLIAAWVTANLMAWCGLAASVTTPVLILYTVEARNSVGMLILAVLALSGLITARASRKFPCPFPQLLMSMALGMGVAAITAWIDSRSDHPVALGEIILRTFQITGLVLPAVSTASGLFSLPAVFTKDIRRKNNAVLNLLTLLALIVTTDTIMTLLGHPMLTWQQLAQPFSLLSIDRYRNMLLAAMQAYEGIPILWRLAVSGSLLLILGRALYVGGRRKLQQRSPAAAPIRPATPPPARPIVSAALSSQPRSTGSFQPRSSGMNAQDAAMLDALAAQTISGRPIGLNTATGVPSISGVRR